METARPLEPLTRLPGVHDVKLDHTRAHFSVDAAELNRVLELFMRHYGDVIENADADAELAGAR